MEGLGIDFILLLWQGAAFGLLVFLLYRFAYKPVIGILDQRAERVPRRFGEVRLRCAHGHGRVTKV